MKNSKDISDMFRQSEPHLRIRPSKEVWSRLENRLDEHHKHRRQFHRQSRRQQWLSIAAAVLLLVTIGLAISLQQTKTTTATASAAPVVFEDLSNYSSEITEQPRKVIEFTRQHHSRLANPVEEGTSDKRLIPKQ